jgi:hypothetical protein
MAWMISSGNFPSPMDAGPIEYFVLFLWLCIVGHCNVFELLDDVSWVFMHVFDKIDDEICLTLL